MSLFCLPLEKRASTIYIFGLKNDLMKYTILLGIMLVLAMGCIGETQAEVQQLAIEIPENVSENDTGKWIDEPVENESTEVNETEEKPIETLDENPPAENEDDNAPAIGQDGPQRTYFDNGNYALVIEDVVWYGDSECAAVGITDAAGSTLKKDGTPRAKPGRTRRRRTAARAGAWREAIPGPA